MSDIEITDAEIDVKFNAMINEIAYRHPCRVLYIEDDVTAALHIQRLFEDKPVEFFHARGPGEADRLLQDVDVDIVVVDISLGTGVPSGEDWILSNRNLLKGKLVLVLSGQLGQIRDLTALRRMVSNIIEKGEEEQKELWQLPARLARKRAADLVHNRVEDQFQQSIGGLSLSEPQNREGHTVSVDESLRQVISGLFRQWVNKIPNQDKGLIYMGNKTLSANDLLHEVEWGTETGDTFLRLFAEDLGELL